MFVFEMLIIMYSNESFSFIQIIIQYLCSLKNYYFPFMTIYTIVIL